MILTVIYTNGGNRLKKYTENIHIKKILCYYLTHTISKINNIINAFKYVQSYKMSNAVENCIYMCYNINVR